MNEVRVEPNRTVIYAAPGLILRPGGGPCEHVLAVARALARQPGVRLHLVIGEPARAEVTPASAGIPKSIRTHLLPRPRDAWAVTDCLALGAHPSRYLEHRNQMLDLADHLSEEKPAVVIERMWGFGGILGARLARRGACYLLEENGPPGFEDRPRFHLTDLLRLVYLGASRWRLRRCYRAAWRVIVQSAPLREQLIRRFGAPRGKVEVIANAIDLEGNEEPRRPGDRARARAALGLPADALLAVYCGSLDRAHHILPVAQAWCDSVAAREGGRLVVMGDGFDRALLERRAETNPALCVLPSQPRPVMAEYLRAADLALAPYSLERFPDRDFYFCSLKVREYLAHDLTVAATRGSAEGFVEDGVHGFLPAEDADWRALFDRLPPRERLHQMGQGGRQRVAGYTYDDVARRYLDLAPVDRAGRSHPAAPSTLVEP